MNTKAKGKKGGYKATGAMKATKSTKYVNVMKKK